MREVANNHELARLDQSALITFFDIDLSKVNGGIVYFCSQLNEKNEAMVWRGRQYTPYPIVAQGFNLSSSGKSNRPTLTVSNLMGWVTGAIAEYDGIVGCTVIRRRVPAKYLDAINFLSEDNPNVNPEFEGYVDRWVINRLTGLNAKTATFELASPCETDGAMIPARQMMADVSPSIIELKQQYGKDAVLPYEGFPSIARM